MNILILHDDPFPIGMAATNRAISNAKGMIENGAEVSVLCLRPYEREGKVIINRDAEGIYQGIKYKYSTPSTVWPTNKFNKLITLIKSFTGSVIEIHRINKQKKVHALILCSNHPVHIILFWLSSRVLKIKYIQEKSEFPFVLNRKHLFGRIYAWFYTTFFYKTFDGIFVMTTPLKEYFVKRIRKNAKIEIIPMTVESGRFTSCTSPPPFPFSYIAYCGYMGGNKDGVDILIKAFKIVADKFKDLYLVLIGDADKAEMELLKRLVTNFSLSDRIVFTGKVERDNIPSLLCNAKILALARPSSLQSTGGFPSKLGEYLATGKPVVVTRVGEIPFYLKDEDNAFLVDPDSAELFAEKIEYVLTNDEVAQNVGRKGSELVSTYFNYRYQAKRLLEFISSV